MSVLSVNSINKTFDGEKILEDVSIEVNKGEIVSLLGTSGVGKTTLFNIIAGLKQPESGKVFLEKKDITGESGNIGYMLQKDLLLPYKTVIDNVALPLIIKGMKKSEARKRAEKYFDEFGLAGTQEKYPSQLSGGMKQRAALLRTYMFSTDVILLDEPFSALDNFTKNNIYKWYLDVTKKLNLTTLIITHDIDEAIHLSNRIYILSGKPGKIAKEIIISESDKSKDDFEFTQEYLDYKSKIASFFKST